MRDFFEAIGRIVGFVVLVGVVAWVRSELQPKPAVYLPPVMPTVTFNASVPPPAHLAPLGLGDSDRFRGERWTMPRSTEDERRDLFRPTVPPTGMGK